MFLKTVESELIFMEYFMKFRYLVESLCFEKDEKREKQVKLLAFQVPIYFESVLISLIGKGIPLCIVKVHHVLTLLWSQLIFLYPF